MTRREGHTGTDTPTGSGVESERAALGRKALALSYFTVGYNTLEGLISVLAGRAAGSIALVGFGLDSFIESLSGGVMIWRFRRHGSISHEEEARIERKATKLVGWTFYILGAYVLYESVTKLIFREAAGPSLIGMVIAVVSLVVMPMLYIMKNRLGRRMGSTSLVADSKQTLACTFLSVALLIGLGANYLFGFWQADPLVGLLIVVFLFKEGREAIREGKLCSC